MLRRHLKMKKSNNGKSDSKSFALSRSVTCQLLYTCNTVSSMSDIGGTCSLYKIKELTNKFFF